MTASSNKPATYRNGGSSHRRPRPGGARRDAYPEDTTYKDTGCATHPACLSCPEPSCLHDTYRKAIRTAHSDRAGLLTNLRQNGATVDALMVAFALSKRSVYRILAEHNLS